MIEPIVILRWLNSVILADTVLAAAPGGWERVARAGVRSPYGIVREEAASEDITGINAPGPYLVASPHIFQTNVYDRVSANYDLIDPLAERLYTLLEGAQAAQDNWVVIWCRRLTVRPYTEVMGDVVESAIEQRWDIGAVVMR